MSRPLVQGIARPSCPQPEHAGGRIWLFGHYARNGHHQRPRFLCVPPREANGRRPTWKRHAFVERLPRRQPAATHPLGRSCQSCWHVAAHHEGPQTGSRFSFAVREAAQALVRVGEGTTLRHSSYKTREHAWPSADPRVPADVSNHAQLAMNYLDAFAAASRIPSRLAHRCASWPSRRRCGSEPRRRWRTSDRSTVEWLAPGRRVSPSSADPGSRKRQEEGHVAAIVITSRPSAAK
jgi:hypothetical protein